MSKERELLQALKDSVDQDPYSSGADAAAQAADKLPVTPDSAGSAAAELDFTSFLEFFNAMGTSMVDDPLFYIKLSGVIILGLLILLVAFELIVGS